MCGNLVRVRVLDSASPTGVVLPSKTGAGLETCLFPGFTVSGESPRIVGEGDKIRLLQMIVGTSSFASLGEPFSLVVCYSHAGPSFFGMRAPGVHFSNTYARPRSAMRMCLQSTRQLEGFRSR